MSETVREMLTDGFGGRLAQWRRRRRMSQLGLALEAGISSRHLSFVETGRSRPSREMVLLLYGALDVPLREQNDLLLAAGFAPVRRETPLDAAPMEGMLAALRLILARHDPFGAVALDRNWDIVMASAAYAAVVNECRLPAESGRPLATLVTPLGLTAPPRPNMLRLLCHPAGYRRRVSPAGAPATTRAMPRAALCCTRCWPIPTCQRRPTRCRVAIRRSSFRSSSATAMAALGAS